jgi:WD40 repeat protein/serine/threonine protein kinase/tetratricopeptide (TPR) repeat protein
MNAEFRRVKEIFLAAVEKQDPAQRTAYVHEACGPDEDLRQQVDALLGRHAQAGSFLEPPAPGPVATVDEQPLSESPGTVIGPYKLLEQIGEGGFGVVFLAEQTQPVRRKVALKVLKPGMDTRQVVARFEAERQALAIMDHPNIAKVFDGGATPSGRPYFVMELVKGVPITEFCDQNQLTPRQRLELFIPVCQAVQHAHQKGIIHRDLKPSNVLVSRHDATPVVKVIDFGVAKALGQELTDKTLFTGIAQMVGTPLYMSPEQAGKSDMDVDTRSDIYSLGVLLYELLTGSTPFPKERFRQAAYDDIRRIIREEEPPRPSTRLSESKDSLASISAQRHTEPAKLTKLVRGELDWIVMKALEKDRARRYETANGFAQDVQRYLADEPVLACPPSAGYRLRKFVRRNKAALAMASVLAGALVLAVVGLSVSNLMVARERDQRTKALSDKERALANESVALTKARKQEGLAKRQQTIAKEQEFLARRRFYAAQENLAQQALEAGQPARALELLESLRPRFDQDDLRGFDWYYLWRLCHRNLYRTLSGPKVEVVYGLAITPDGKTLVSGSTDASVRVWDVATGKERAVLSGHGAMIWSLAISPDGKIVASGSGDNTVKLWDLGTRELLATLAGRTEMVRSVAFSPDGKVLAAGTEDGALELWDVATRQRRLTLQASFAPIGVAYSPDGKMLVTASGWSTSRGKGSVKVWDMTSEPPRVLCELSHSLGVTFSPDSKLLATCHFRDVKVWSVPSGELKATFDSLNSRVESAAFLADGKTLALGGADRAVKLWEFGNGSTRTVGVHLGTIFPVVFSPKAGLLASGSDDGTVKLWHVSPPQDALSFTHKSAIRLLAFTPDSKLLVVGNDGPTTVLDAATGKETTTLPVGGVLAASVDANLLAGGTGAPEDKRVIWDVAAARARAVLPVGWQLRGAAFSRDGKTLVTWTGGGGAPETYAVRLWDLATSRVRLTLKDDNSIPYCAALSPDDRTLATGHQFGMVTLRDATTGQQRMALQQREGATRDAVAVAFSNNGKMLAAGNSEGILRLWDVETGQLKVSFKGHTDKIGSVAFSPDDRILLSGSVDRTARLWDVVTGQELLTLKGHKFSVHLVAFAPDGKRLATASHNEVKLWLAATESEATAFRVELDPDDADSPRAMNNWGDRLQEIHRPQEAESAYRKSLARLEKLADALPGTPDYRQELAYSLLAPSLMTDPPPAAWQSHRQFLEIWRTLPADRQFRLLNKLNERGVHYWFDKRLDRSIPLFEAAVRLNRANRPEDVATYNSIANLAVNYRDAGRLREATPLFEEVVAWGRKHPAAGANQVAWVTGELVDTYERDQQFAKAEPLLREALQRARQRFGAADPRTAGPLAHLGFTLLRQRKYADAEPLLRDCLALREKAEADAWTTFNAKSMLGGCLLGEKKYAEAEPLLLQGYEGMKQREAQFPPAGKVRLPEAVERLVQLYDDWGKPEQAAEWRKKLEEK